MIGIRTQPGSHCCESGALPLHYPTAFSRRTFWFQKTLPYFSLQNVRWKMVAHLVLSGTALEWILIRLSFSLGITQTLTFGRKDYLLANIPCWLSEEPLPHSHPGRWVCTDNLYKITLFYLDFITKPMAYFQYDLLHWHGTWWPPIFIGAIRIRRERKWCRNLKTTAGHPIQSQTPPLPPANPEVWLFSEISGRLSMHAYKHPGIIITKNKINPCHQLTEFLIWLLFEWITPELYLSGQFCWLRTVSSNG